MAFDEVLKHYGENKEWTIIEGPSGWNNTTRFVEADGRKWVLRIYETHKDSSKIQYEHEVLLALQEQTLPFQVPLPVRSNHGGTIVRLEDGTDRLACLFTYIDGIRPSEQRKGIAKVFGVASGQLSKAMSQLRVPGKPMYSPYYEMDSAYPLCTPAKVAAFCNTPLAEFRVEAEGLRFIGKAIENFRAYLPEFRGLPHQLIHGDINTSNSLINENCSEQLAAILDFEFCTWDLRVMEFAVILSSLLNGEDALERIEQFLSGIGSQLRLEQAEAEAIPLLVQLRILDVFLHFLSRYWEGVDGSDVLLEQTRSVYEGLRKLEQVEDELLELGVRHLTT